MLKVARLLQNWPRRVLANGTARWNSIGPASTLMELSNGLIVTKSCARRIRQLQGAANNDKLSLRICVESGGCSGFQYIFKMEEPTVTAEDALFERDGTKVVVDTASLELIKGSTVDFVQEMIRSSFAILSNPQSESACGCGSSFAVKNFSANPAKD